MFTIVNIYYKYRNMIPAVKDKKNPKYKELSKFSNIGKAQQKATDLYKDLGTLYISEKKDKKFKILDPFKKKFVHFGQMNFEDHTKHNDDIRRVRFLQRSLRNTGNWKKNIFSPNNLSIYILW